MTRKEKIIDMVQWILIVVLIGICWNSCEKIDRAEQGITTETENTYLRIYDSQAIEDLRIRNRSLEDSIKKLNNVESVVEFKYVTTYKTDTVFVSSPDSIAPSDSIIIQPFPKDSIYHHEENTDSVSYSLDIKANKLYWYKLDFTVNDSLLLVTREKDGMVSTSIMHGSTSVIEDVNMWHRKNETWKDKFSIGPSIGVGYGFMNHNVDVFVGVSVTYDLW